MEKVPEPQETFQYEPNAEEEGEGWGSDGHVEICTSNLAGTKKRKKRKRSAGYITVGCCLGCMQCKIIKMELHYISLSLQYTIVLFTMF